MDQAAKSVRGARKKPAHRVGQYQTATTKKLSVSLDVEAAEWAQEAARKQGKSVSAIISDAVNEKRRFEAMDQYLAECDRVNPIPDDEKQRLDAEIEAEWRAAGLIK